MYFPYLRLLLPLRKACDRSPTARGTVGEQTAASDRLPLSPLGLLLSAEISPPPLAEVWFLHRFEQEEVGRWSRRKGKRAALCQPHVASSATQKLSPGPSSAVRPVLSAIVGGKSRVSALKRSGEECAQETERRTRQKFPSENFWFSHATVPRCCAALTMCLSSSDILPLLPQTRTPSQTPNSPPVCGGAQRWSAQLKHKRNTGEESTGTA